MPKDHISTAEVYSLFSSTNSTSLGKSDFVEGLQAVNSRCNISVSSNFRQHSTHLLLCGDSEAEIGKDDSTSKIGVHDENILRLYVSVYDPL
jgi:hypothetical protein